MKVAPKLEFFPVAAFTMVMGLTGFAILNNCPCYPNNQGRT